MSRGSLLAVASIAALAGCQVKDGRVPAKIPAGVSIPVTVDGGASATLDTAWLEAHEPDFRDAVEDRRAWKLSALTSSAATATMIEVASSGGPAAELRPAADAVPVITFNKQREAVVKLVDPKDPFPAFHGRGGNRGRGGDDERVRSASSIRVHLAPAPSGRPLSVTVGAAESTTIDLMKFPMMPFTAKDGAATSGWSLHEIARQAAGENGRVDVVTGNETVSIPAEDWNDPEKTPLLRVNARGELKLDWSARDGSRTDGPEAHAVRAVHVLR